MGTIRKIEGKTKTSYESIIRIKGSPTLTSRFSTRKEAENWITTNEANLLKGEIVSRATLEKTSIKDILESYVLHHERTDDEGKIYYTGIGKTKVYNVGVLIHHLGSYTIKTLTHQKIGKFVSVMLDTDIPPPAKRVKIHKNYNGGETKKYSPATVRRYYYDLKGALEWWAFPIKFNLDDRFERQNIPENWSDPRMRRLEDGEEKKLLDACLAMYKAPRQWQLVILFALETAMRPSEYLQLKWSDVHLEEHNRFVGVREATNKTKLNRQVPLSRKAMGFLQELESKSETKTGRVFDLIPHKSFSASFKMIANRAGSVNLRAHDFRCEAISRIFQRSLSMSVPEIMLMTGHVELSTLKGYMSLRPSIMANKLD